MKLLLGGRRTLRRRLVSRVALMLGLLMVAVNIGLAVLLLMLLPKGQQADYHIRPEIARAIGVEGGELIVKPEAVASLKEAAPDLWFIAGTADGRRLVFNDVPSAYAPLIRDFQSVRYMDVRGPDGAEWTAVMTDMDTDAGEVSVLYGGKAMPNPSFLELLWGLKIIYIPLILAPMLIVFIAVPLIIGRALKGVAETTSRASRIDAARLGERLPKDDVVEELHPLVDGINAALARIDEGVSRNQRFLTNAAHELRTPIAILQTRIQTMDPGPQRDRLLLDATRLGATAEHLLDFERFGTSHRREDVDLVAICETVAADIAPVAIAAGYEIGFDARVTRHVVKGDPASLERAVANLAMNAVQHADGRGRILIEVTETGAVEVSDEGPGVQPDQREKVFEPFYRVAPKSTGAGLGLSLVRQIAEAHCGQVRFIDQTGGARVRLALSAT